MKTAGKLGIIVAVAALGACSTAVDKTQVGLGDAAMAPLTDLNLRRTEVPALLEGIRSPYEPIPVVSCQAIGVAIAELTNILGPDADAPPGPEASLADRAGSGAADLALNTVSSTMTDFIPFRSIVREASGASAHVRKLRAAYERGVARRAYLKGVGAQLGCAPPAAPEPNAGMAPPRATIEYRNQTQPR